jgi:hypothetical protein
MKSNIDNSLILKNWRKRIEKSELTNKENDRILDHDLDTLKFLSIFFGKRFN